MPRHLIILLLVLFLLSGCISKGTQIVSEAKDSVAADKIKSLAESAKVTVAEANAAVEKCQQLCQEFRKTIDLNKSPCLSNQIIENWVCDVAHNPRIEIDNLPQNQCEAYRNRTAEHFVELDTNCNVIKLA